MNQTNDQLINGLDIRMGRTVYKVPAISARQYTKYRPTLQMLSSLDGREPNNDEIAAFVDLVHAVLMRNYPDLAIETVWDTMNMRTMPAVIEAITGRGDDAGANVK